MDWTNVSYLILLLNILGLSHAYFEKCDKNITIGAGKTTSIESDGYDTWDGYMPGSSCRYTIVAPVDYQVRASCSLDMYDPSTNGSCSSERFYFAIDGRKDLGTSYFFCDWKTVTLTSNGNQMVLAYISTNYSGVFSCSISTTCDCGWSLSSRIVNGTAAKPNEFPPMAGLVSTTTAKIYCGGAIISSRYVLTAAHCLRVTTVNNTKIVVGEHDVSTGADSQYTKIYNVSSFLEHPLYSNDLNDIGLVQTATAIIWSRVVAPACLPFYYTTTTFAGTTLTALGWGSMEFGGPSSNVLQKVGLNVISNTQCRKYYPKVSTSQLCTLTAQKDTCQYDSGGPLFYQGSDARLFLVALVSLGDGCATGNPAENSRITSFLSWIESKTGSLCRRTIL